VTRLVLHSTLRNIRLWLAAGPLIALTTAVLVAVFSMRTVGGDLEAEEVGLMDNYLATMLALTLVAALGSTAVAVDRAASRSRQRIGRFSLVGLSPTYAMTLFYHQIVALACLFVAVGLAVGAWITPAAIQVIVRASSGHVGVTGHVDTHALVGAAVIALGVAIIGSVRGAQVARSVQPVEAVKPLPWAPRRSARVKTVASLASALGVVATAIACCLLPARQAYTGRPIAAANAVVIAGGLMTAFMAVLFALTANLYCPVLIRAWTIILPENHAPTLLLGRRGSAYQAARSLHSFNLVLVGCLIVGAGTSIYFARSSMEPAGRGWVAARDMSSAVLGAVPVGFALTASVLVVAITARNRFAEAQTLRLVGATPRQILLTGAFEAAILAVTATVVGYIGQVVVALVVGASMARIAGGPGWPEALGFDWIVWVAPLGVTVLGMALVTVTSLPSLVRGLRHPVF
jgi:predicted lysophospholipase L1 biosynthesis ABC-type transport system permease subunit